MNRQVKSGINIFTVKGRVSHYYFSLYWFTFGEKLKFIVLIINIFAVYAGPIFSAIKISTMKYVILNLIFLNTFNVCFFLFFYSKRIQR